MYRTIVVALGRRRRRRRHRRRRRRRRRVVSFGWRARRQLCPHSDGWYISRAHHFKRRACCYSSCARRWIRSDVIRAHACEVYR